MDNQEPGADIEPAVLVLGIVFAVALLAAILRVAGVI